jgi:hypothetical protein
MTVEQARAKGISLRAARGHGGDEAEKKPLERRRAERGEPNDYERRFFYLQFRKTMEGREYDDAEEYWADAFRAWAAAGPAKRAAVMARQRQLSTGYRIRKAISRRARRAGSQHSPITLAPGPSGSVELVRNAGGGGGLGPGFSVPGYDFGTGKSDFDTWIDADFPEIDDFEFLVYYH